MCSRKFISESRVRDLLTWEKVIEASETSLKSVSTRCAFQCPRMKIALPNSKNLLFVTSGYLVDSKYGALINRTLAKFPNNTKMTPPMSFLHATITIIDDETGLLKAIIEGNELGEWRTAAVSLVATKYLHHEKQKRILAIIGAGNQGRIHAIAFQKYFNFDEVRIWNRTGIRAVNLCKELNRDLPKDLFITCDTVKECLNNADVIVCSTTGINAVEYRWIKKGAHINAISVNPPHIDLDALAYTSSKVYCDYWLGANYELGYITALGVKLVGQVGDVITGSLPVPEKSDTTIFQSLGMAVEDCAMARMIYDLDKANEVQ